MTDDLDLEQRLAAADPLRHAPGGPSIDVALADLAGEITATSRLREARPGDRAARRRGARPVVTTGIAASIVAVGVLGFIAGRAGDSQPSERAVGSNESTATAVLSTTTVTAAGAGPPTTAMAAVPTGTVADAAMFEQFPFTILPGDNWVLTRVDQQPPWTPMNLTFHRADVAVVATTAVVRITDPRTSEVVGRSTDDDPSLEVTWFSEDHRDSWADQGATETPITILGHDGVLFADEDNYWVAVLPVDGGSVEFRIEARDDTEVEQILASFHVVDQESFDAALPAAAVPPDRRTAVVNQMLVGMSVPPGLDLSAVRTEQLYSDWYQLGARVAGTVACAWFDRWFTAAEAGEIEAAEVAAGALASTRGWRVLQEMTSDGAYPDVLWDYTDGIDGDWPGGELGRTEIDAGLGCGWGLELGDGTAAPTTTAPG